MVTKTDVSTKVEGISNGLLDSVLMPIVKINVKEDCEEAKVEVRQMSDEQISELRQKLIPGFMDVLMYHLQNPIDSLRALLAYAKFNRDVRYAPYAGDWKKIKEQ